MKFLSVCSGIEAASVAWNPLGWEACAFSEIEKFPSAVLSHHYPDIENIGNLMNYEKWRNYEPDVVVGGTPCQSFSVAGLRKGLEDPRGNLSLVFLGLLARQRPRWVVWENVPGVLSDKTGAFGALLGGLAKLGYGFAYRVLDAQYFGVPQRRRRVFVVGCLGDWRAAAAVLFEPESLRGDSPPSREAGKVAPTIPSRSTGGGGLGTDFDCDGGLIPEIANPLSARMGKGFNSTLDEGQTPIVTHTLQGEGFDTSEDGTGRGTPLVPIWHADVSTVDAKNNIDRGDKQHLERLVAFDTTQISSKHNWSNPKVGDPCHPLAAGAHAPAIAFSCKDHGGDAGSVSPTLRSMNHSGSHANGGGQVAITGKSGVRRLTPMECERLQGFPDGHTDIPWRKDGSCPDGPRYKALGNSMAVPVMRWIGERIQGVERMVSK